MTEPPLSETVKQRLQTERNIWFSSVRADGRPHLVPIWFAWHVDKLYGCIQPGSVKAHNLTQNPQVALSLEDGSSVVICEGTAISLDRPWSEAVRAIFREKYDWDIFTSTDYTMLIEVTPQKWLVW